MPTLPIESVFYGTVFGIALTFAVALAMKLIAPLNAATRAVIWSVTLVSLPIIPFLYFAGHMPRPVRPVVVAAQPFTKLIPLAAPMSQVDVAPPQSQASVPHRFNLALPEHLSEGLLGFYVVTVAFLLIRLAVSYIRLRLLRWRTYPAPLELTARLQLWLNRCPTSRRVELRLSNTARSPLAIGFFKPVIVMPASLALELRQQEYDDLGVHELAHIRRYDDWTNLLQRILQALLFFHPASHYLGRKLNLEREIACDDWVVSNHESKAYARCLTKVVELRRYQREALLLSSGAFFGKRQIINRVESLLDKSRNAATNTSNVAVICIVSVLAAVASQVINLPAVVAFTQDEAGATTSSRWSDESHDLRIKLRGEVTFSDDEQSIAALSPGGFFIVDETRGWSHRRLEVRSGVGGGPQVKYFLDSREKPLDGVGHAWAASSYLFALRELGLDGEARVARILTRRGPAGVIEETGLIHSDHVKCEYLNHLLEQAKLTTGDLQRIADSVRKISSDNDKTDFLIAHQRDLSADGVRTSYFSAVNSIHSDNDRRRLLMRLLETQGHDPETARLIGLSAKSMNSDNDKADVLLAIPAATSADARCGLLNAARTIQSDNDKARVLKDAGYVESAQCRDAYFAVVNLIHSDNDRSEVLQTLLKSPSLESDTDRNIADSARTMNSDNDKANVLVQLAARYSGQPLFDSANSIQSSNDRMRVLNAVLETHPAKAQMLSVINSSLGLSDDNDKAEVLLTVAKQTKEPEVRSALQKACEKLSSDNDYRRVASAIFNGSPESSK